MTPDHGIRYGVSPIAWSNDDLPALGGDTPLTSCLREAREVGYAGIELGSKFPRSRDELRALLADHGLELVSGWFSGGLLEHTLDEEIARIRPHLELLLAMGCRVLVYAETTGTVHNRVDRPLESRPVLRREDWPAFGRKLTGLADHLAAQGIRLAYHHHAGTVVQDGPEIERLVDLSGDSVGLVLDTGHAVLAGADPAVLAGRLGRRVVHVHCKDVRPAVLSEIAARRMSFLDAVMAGVFTVPGDGDIDFRAALRPLAESGYSGWLVVEAEQDPAVAEPKKYARTGLQNLRRYAGDAGFAGS